MHGNAEGGLPDQISSPICCQTDTDRQIDADRQTDKTRSALNISASLEKIVRNVKSVEILLLAIRPNASGIFVLPGEIIIGY